MRFSLIMQRGKGNGSNKHSSLLPSSLLEIFPPREVYDAAHPLVTLAVCILGGNLSLAAVLPGISRGWRCGVTGRQEEEGWEPAVIDISQSKGEEHWSRVTCNPLDQIAIDNFGNFPRLVQPLYSTAS